MQTRMGLGYAAQIRVDLGYAVQIQADLGYAVQIRADLGYAALTRMGSNYEIDERYRHSEDSQAQVRSLSDYRHRDFVGNLDP